MAEIVAGAVAKWLTAAGLTATIGTGASAVGVATVLANLGTSLLFSAIARKLSARGGPGDSQIPLDNPQSVVIKRDAYGWARIEGTPAAVIGRPGGAYLVWIVNSRPSTEIETIEFDKRVLTLTGDITDFATGATATDAVFGSYVKLWAGLGDQTSIPDQILAEVGDPLATDEELFWDTDMWRGRTVIWARIEKGSNKTAGQRWSRIPPELRVTGKWTPVYDPRDGAQDPDDPATWVWSDNQALCLLDALRFNPIARLPLDLIHLTSIEYQADVADEAVARKAGGTEPRYRVGGRIVYAPGVELYQALGPLDMAGGGSLVQIGGTIGYQPGEYLAPADTITDVLRRAPLGFTALVRGDALPRAIRAVYPNPGGGWEDASLIPIPVPGAGGWTGGDDRVEDLALPLVPYPAQANRLAQIKARQLGCQKRISGILLPRHLDLVAGANVTFEPPRDGDERAGVYQLIRINGAGWLGESGTLPLSLAFEARGIGADVYAWTAATDEQDYPAAAVTQPDLVLAAPAALALSQSAIGLALVLDMVLTPPASEAQITGYEWEWQVDAGDWNPGGAMASTEPGPGAPATVTAQFFGAVAGSDYKTRARSVALGRVSAWVESNTVTPDPLDITIDAGVGP